MSSFVQRLRESRVTDGIILSCAAALLVLVLLAFFVDPRYEKGAWIGMFTFSNALSASLAFKFGITVPGVGTQKPTKSDTEIEPFKVTCPKCGNEFSV